ncbi:unnamed protein product [Oppiella nova]|uniref:BolA-like protein n=1 Tax=Oppiella nova TaxID=334625 RepID=A0A7R9MLC4_9ACAR|nr:unnamed protein product [Oppiella nova]CAG2179539.1 unnamed protein product [Oppiella nova]
MLTRLPVGSGLEAEDCIRNALSALRRPYSKMVTTSSQTLMEDTIRRKKLSHQLLSKFTTIHICMLITRQWKVAPPKKLILGNERPPSLNLVRVFIASDAFKSKMQPARHRMVYALLKDELAMDGGIHALQLRTRTEEENEKAQAKETS